MAVISRDTLVLCGVTVLADVVTGKTGDARYPANDQTPALPLHLRHLSRQLGTVFEPDAGQLLAMMKNHGTAAAVRAGRPDCCSGVPSRSPAPSAGAGGAWPCPAPAWCSAPFTGRARADQDMACPWHLQGLRLGGLPAGKPAETRSAAPMSTGGTPPASTWGMAVG
jgi:hypothetical protein